MNEYAENSFAWSKAGSIEHGLGLLREGQDGVDFTALSFNKDDFVGISSLLEQNEKTRALRFERCQIEASSFSPLSSILPVNNVLCYLYLYGNCLGDEGTAALGRDLRKNTSLQFLSLSNNNMGDLGARELGETLRNNNTLRFLFLAKNDITDRGISSLATALAVNSGLLELVLSYNPFGEEGDVALAEALKVNNHLESLSLHQQEGEISSRGAKALLAALQVNRNVSIYSMGLVNGPRKLARRATKLIKQSEERRSRRRSARKETFTSFLADGQTKSAIWGKCRLMVVGEGRSGKTATVRSLQGSAFTEDLRSTVGVRVLNLQTQQRTKSSKWRVAPKRKSSLLISFAARLSISKERESQVQLRHRISLHRRSRSRSRSRPRRKSSATSAGRGRLSSRLSQTRRVSNNLDSNEARKLSFRGLRFSMKRSSSEASSATGSVNSSAQEEKSLPPIVAKEEAQNLAREEVFIEAAEELDDKVISFTIWDYGGQDVFYPLHHLFLSSLGIYTAVFNLVSFLQDEKKALQYLSFWLHSIHMHAPSAPIFIVGTFLDELPHPRKNLDRSNKILIKLLEPFSQIVANEEENLVFFPITNTDSTTIKSFRAKVEEVARSLSFVQQEVDLRWVGLLEQLQDLAFRDERNIPFAKAAKTARKLGLVDTDEVRQILSFFNEHGLLVYLMATLELRKWVIINPQWLIDKISAIIRDTRLHRVDMNSLQVKGLVDDAKRLEDRGIVSTDLLEYFWHESEFDFLLSLMQQTMLLSEYCFSDEKEYLVPSMVQQKSSEFASLPCAILLSFHQSFLPQGLFERIICLLLNTSQGSEEPQVFRGQAKFILNDEAFVVKQHSQEIEISCHPSLAALLLQSCLQILSKINRDIFRRNLFFKIFLSAPGVKKTTPTEAKKEQLAPWFGVTKEIRESNMSLDLEALIES